METGMDANTCPNGHMSVDIDYCSECGAKLTAGQNIKPLAANGSFEICPDCGTPREQAAINFCEVCGYNFVTGAHGEIGILPDPGASDVARSDEEGVHQEAESAKGLAWLVCVMADSRTQADDSSPRGEAGEILQIELSAPVYLIGRRDETRGILPDIDLSLDEAVSRRHALLLRGAENRISIRDIGAANGTRLNEVELEPMVDYLLKDGDTVTLGHRSKLQVQAFYPEL